MIWASLLVKPEGVLEASRDIGDYGFPQLPAAGDHIQVKNGRQKLELLQVLYIQHSPLPGPGVADWPDKPIIHVICRSLGEIAP